MEELLCVKISVDDTFRRQNCILLVEKSVFVQMMMTAEIAEIDFLQQIMRRILAFNYFLVWIQQGKV